MVLRTLLKWIRAIAQHGKTEQILRHLAMAIEHADEGIVIFELNGTIRFINTAWATMHGYETSSELLGKNIAAFYTPEQFKSTVTPLIQGATRKGMLHGKAEHIRKDRTTFPASVKMTLIKEHTGKAIGLIALAADITERKRLQDLLMHTTEQSKELEKQIDQLRSQIDQRANAEQTLRQQAANLAAANQQLQNEIASREQNQGSLKSQADQLAAANQQLQNEITQRAQAEKNLNNQAADLEAANQQLQTKITELEQAQKMLKETDQQDEEAVAAVPPINPEELKALSEMARKLT